MNKPIESLQVNIPEQGKKFILKRIEKIIDSKTAWTDDKYVLEFEQEFSKYLNSKYAIAVNSGLSALQTAIFSLGLNESEGIAFVPTLTAPPTALACLYSGLKVVFVDSNIDDLGMDINDLRAKIKKYNQKKSVIIPVHISGIVSSNINDIVKLGHENNIMVIEDCAHAHGATYNGIYAGMYADVGAFSFFMTKVLMSGEGGIIVTNSKEHNEKCRIVRNYGKRNGIYEYKGSNWRMSDLNAVVALWQTLDAKRLLSERRKIAKLYDNLLQSHTDLKPLRISSKGESAYYKYVVYVPLQIDRSKLKNILKQKYNITLSGAVYERPCHREPVFSKFNSIINLTDVFPQSDFIADRQICLPIYPGLDNESVGYIAASLKESLQYL